MKNTKKIASIILAIVMVLAMAIPAFATEGTTTPAAKGSITIDNAIVGQKYKLYQILDLESYNKDANAYSYKATTAWADFINSAEIKGVYVDVNAQGYVTWHMNKELNDDGTVKSETPADVVTFAKLAKDYAADNNIAPSQPEVTATSTDATAKTTTVTFSDLDLGYYLVDSTLGTICSLDTTNPDVTMKEKNAEPTNEKQVEEDSNNTYGEKNDADIGQVVNFKSTITLPEGSENVVFHDKMSAGLTLDKNSIKVYTDEAMTTALTLGTEYKQKIAGEAEAPTDDCTFEVSFEKAYLDGIDDGDDTVNTARTLYVCYSATVNAGAVIAGAGNENESKLSYGDETNTKTTPESKTTTYTWQFDVFKYTKNAADEKVALAGATFTLSKNADGSDPIKFVAETKDGVTTYRVATAEEADTAVTEITTGDDGLIKYVGLDADTYYLTETKAPDGYNVLPEAVTVTINNEGKVNATDENPNGVAQVEVENNTGAELPETGGVGTTIFYIVGSILLVGAAILLIAKRRMSAAK